MTTGRLHSIETFGAVDGPGIRTVFFMQGCPARCAYCHNPDTWDEKAGLEITIDEIVRRAKRGIPYYGDKGGVTFSGGEPLLQGKFLIDAIKALKTANIGSAIDTSGTYWDDDSEEAIRQADLVILDIKHIDEEKFRELTGRSQGPLMKFIDTINKLHKPVWIRQVIVPGFNDSKEYIEALNDFLSRFDAISNMELLGYHNMAEAKYEKLGIKYRLKGTPPMNSEKLENLRRLMTTA